MKKWLSTLLFIILAFLPLTLRAQSTIVTATIIDSDSIAWANGTFSVSFVQVPGNPGPYLWQGVPMTPSQVGPYPGTMNASGVMTVTLPSNSAISPAGTLWNFTLCPNASAVCTQIRLPVNGASVSFTSQFSAAAIAPRFPANGVGSYGYANIEISPPPVPGGAYFNVSALCTYVWNGSAWACNGGGGGSSNITINGAPLITPGTANFQNTSGNPPGAINFVNVSAGNVQAAVANISGGGSALLACTTTNPLTNQVYGINPSGICSNLTLGVPPLTVTASSFAITSAMRGNQLQLQSGASALTIPQAGSAGFGANFYVDITNPYAGTVTFTPAVSSVNGAASAPINPGQTCQVRSNNTNYTMNCMNGVGLGINTIGLNNALNYAPGITIGDGTVHTIGSAPTGSVFHGLTTLAQVAAININGQTPFAWITVAPSTNWCNFITVTGTGRYVLTNSDVPNLDIAWLAIQAVFLTGQAYVPTGEYIIGSARPLPLCVPVNIEAATSISPARYDPSMYIGDGMYNTKIIAGSDFGAGYPLISCQDPGATVSNEYGRYEQTSGGECAGQLQEMSFYDSSGAYFPAVGTTNVSMDGIYWGSRLRMTDLAFLGFNRQIDVVGDHTQWIRLRMYGGGYGLFMDVINPALTGDLASLDTFMEGQSIAGMGAAAGGRFSQMTFEGETGIFTVPFGIQALQGCTDTDFMEDVRFERLFVEQIGNALINDDNNVSSGTWTASNMCRNVISTTIDHLYTNQNNAFTWFSGGRGRVAMIAANDVDINIGDLNMVSSQFAPISQTGPAQQATFVVNAPIALGRGTSVTGDIFTWIAESGSLPLLATSAGYGFSINQTGSWVGSISKFYSTGNYGTTTGAGSFNGGDLLESDSGGVVAAGTSLDAPAAGLALQSGITNGEYLPVMTGGYNNFNTTPLNSWTGPYKKSTGIRGITITAPGSSGTNGTFRVLATGGLCSVEPVFQFTVAGGLITLASVIDPGSGCYGIPTLPTSASSGLTGATLTAGWPAALATNASSTQDGQQIGWGSTTAYGAGISFAPSQTGANYYTLAVNRTYNMSLAENPLSDGGNFTDVTGWSAVNVSAVGTAQPSATSTNCGVYYSGQTWSADQFSEVTLGNLVGGSSSGIIPSVRIQTGATTMYQLQITGAFGSGAGSMLFVYNSAGTGTPIGATVTGLTLSAGDVIRFEVVGSVLSAWQNGSLIAIREDTNLTSGYPGFDLYSSVAVGDATISRWSGGAQIVPGP